MYVLSEAKDIHAKAKVGVEQAKRSETNDGAQLDNRMMSEAKNEIIKRVIRMMSEANHEYNTTSENKRTRAFRYTTKQTYNVSKFAPLDLNAPSLMFAPLYKNAP